MRALALPTLAACAAGSPVAGGTSVAGECACDTLPVVLSAQEGGLKSVTNGEGTLAIATVVPPADANYLVIDATMLLSFVGFPAGYAYELRVGAETVLEESTATSCGGGSVFIQPLTLHYLYELTPADRAGDGVDIALTGSAEPCNANEYEATIEVARMYVTAVR